MSSDRARDALSQCLPAVFTTSTRYGYRGLADRLDEALAKRGFQIISQETYNRLNANGQGDTWQNKSPKTSV